MAVLQDKRGRWCFDFYSPTGSRSRRVCPSFEAARALDSEHTRRQRRARATRLQAQALEPLTLSAALALFLADRSPAYLKPLRHRLSLFLEHCGPDRLLQSITGETINAFVAKLRHAARSPHTIYAARWDAARLLLWAVREGYLLRSPHLDSKPLPRPPFRVTLPTPAELATLLTRASPILRRALLLAKDCGLRSGEIVRARWLDYDRSNALLHVHTLKHGPPALLWCSPELRASLSRGPLAANHGSHPGPYPSPHEFLVPLTQYALDAAVRRHRRRCGLHRPIRLHDLRHLLATNLIRAGEPLPVVQRVLRHRSARITEQYVHLADPDSTRALMNLHGLRAVRSASASGGKGA